MDPSILAAERRRISDEFRARLGYLAVMRTRWCEVTTDEARQWFRVALHEEAALCRELGAKLLQIEARLLASMPVAGCHHKERPIKEPSEFCG
jgi:hypothetical protein